MQKKEKKKRAGTLLIKSSSQILIVVHLRAHKLSFSPLCALWRGVPEISAMLYPRAFSEFVDARRQASTYRVTVLKVQGVQAFFAARSLSIVWSQLFKFNSTEVLLLHPKSATIPIDDDSTLKRGTESSPLNWWCGRYTDAGASSAHRASRTERRSCKRLPCHYAWRSSAGVAQRHLSYETSCYTLRSDISTTSCGSSLSPPPAGFCRCYYY